MSNSVRLVVLILSYDEGPHRLIQVDGQDKTFISEAAERTLVFRYVGRQKITPFWLKAMFHFRRFQYLLLDFSNYRPIAFLVRRIASFRFLDKIMRSIPQRFPDKSSPGTKEIASEAGAPRRIITDTPEDWSLIGLKTILAFNHVLDNYEFDYIFRTNTSSYLDTAKLLEFLEDQPRQNQYAGVVGVTLGDTKFASGAGILLSKDVVQRVCDKADGWKHGLVDDVALADLIQKIDGPSVEVTEIPRVDIATVGAAQSLSPEIIKQNFHFRCKAKSADETIKIMRYIHQIKNS
jgi:hypothetical protein